jgi:CRP/FNR family transcriptional regulator
MSELLETIDKIAFMKLDERLLKYLQQKAGMSINGCITTTHNAIAQDLNTSRVVISRLLKQLENKQILRISRNQICMQ